MDLSNFDSDQIDILPLFLNTLWKLSVDIVKWCSQFLNQTHMLYSFWFGSATLSHTQRTPMTIFRNLGWGYISDATWSFCTLKRSIKWLWERFCVSQADVLFSRRADSTLSDHHITCSIYVNQVQEMVLTNRSLNFAVRTLQPHRADTCIFQHMSHATYQSFCMNDNKWYCCSDSQFIWKKVKLSE